MEDSDSHLLYLCLFILLGWFLWQACTIYTLQKVINKRGVNKWKSSYSIIWAHFKKSYYKAWLYKIYESPLHIYKEELETMCGHQMEANLGSVEEINPLPTSD